MITTIAYDIRSYLFVLTIVLFGFAQAFWVLSYYPDEKVTTIINGTVTIGTIPNELVFGTIQNSLLYSFLFMLGQSNTTDFDGSANPKLAIFLLVMFLGFMALLMLNLLIGKLSVLFFFLFLLSNV